MEITTNDGSLLGLGDYGQIYHETSTTDITLAWGYLLLTTLPKSILGNVTSEEYISFPVTFEMPSLRLVTRPIVENSF